MAGLTSIIIPTHNRSDLLRETLESAFASEAEVEILVVDDASDDDTPDVLARLAAGNPSLTYERSEVPIGACRARNRGLSRARGDFVMFLDSDDLIHRTKVARQVAFLESHPEVDAVVSQMAHFHRAPGDSDLLWNTFAGRDLTIRYLSHDPVWGMHAPLWRTSVVRSLGGLDESLPMAQDFEFHARALLRGVRFHLVPELTAFCRRHPGPSISADRALRRLETLLGVMDGLERVRALSSAESLAVQGTRLWLADLAATQRDARLCSEALRKARPVPKGFALWTTLHRWSGRHRFHLWARTAAIRAGHDLDVRERWYLGHRVGDEPALVVPEDVPLER